METLIIGFKCTTILVVFYIGMNQFLKWWDK